MEELVCIINHYMDNGDQLGLSFSTTEFDRHVVNNPEMQEFKINYAKKLKKNMYLDAMIGYAKIDNANYERNKSNSTKMMGLGLRWEY